MIGMAERPAPAAQRRRGDVLCPAIDETQQHNALTVASSLVFAAGARPGCRREVPSALRFWDEIIEADATAYMLRRRAPIPTAQPPKPVDRAHRVRLAVGNGLRPEIWDEFQSRFGIDRIVEFYSRARSNIGTS